MTPRRVFAGSLGRVGVGSERYRFVIRIMVMNSLPASAVTGLCLWALLVAPAVAAEPEINADQAWIERIAEAQKRTAASENVEEASHRELLQLSIDFPMRTDWLMQDLPNQAYYLFLPNRFNEARQRLAEAHDNDPYSKQLLEDYLAACEQRRKKRLAQVIDRWAPFVFAEGATHQMSFIGYTEGLSDARHERFFKAGSRLTVLDFDKGSTHGKPRTLIDDPHGMLRDVDVSHDRERLLFAWKKSDRLDDYHIYEYALKDGSVRQLTTGIGRADYEPIYLPGGDIMFASTRPEQSVPCWWTEISNLYRMNGNGEFVRRLAIDQVHTLYPQVLSNGRVCYTRWDYNDRGQNYPHPVFEMDPDGKGQRVFYGGNSWFPTSLLHTRAIPGSHKVMSIAAGHHTRQRGKLVVVDTNEGRDEGAGIHFIAPNREVPYERVDVAMQYGDQFRYPYPLSETELIVSYLPDYGFDPNQYVKKKSRYGFKDGEHFGLYWMNAEGERELLHRAPDLGVLRPGTLGERPTPPEIPDTVDYTKKTGTYYVEDVYQGVGLKGVKRGEAKKIRVVRLNYRAAGVGKTHNRGEGGGSINSAPVSIANGTWDVKEIIGDADVHEDGSAFFEVPAMESIYLQVLDAKGRALQTTRTWDTLRPGEHKSCKGCHDKSTPTHDQLPSKPSLAIKNGVQKLQPFYGEMRGFSFNKEIQPILDKNCVTCHDGKDEKLMDLTATPVDGNNLNKRQWTQSYLNLTGAKPDKNKNYIAVPEEGLVKWISKMSRPTELPHSQGSIISPLIHMLDEGHHDVKLSDEEYHKLVAWIDLLVPFSGTYREGGDWSDKDKSYYSYYETKRHAQAKEEMAAIKAYMATLGGKKAEAIKAAEFIEATYRSLPIAKAWEPIEKGGWKLKQGHEPSLVDRIELAKGVGIAGMKVKHGEDIIGEVSFANGDGVLVLDQPVRSDELIITDIIARENGVRGVQLFGVHIKELPESDGFKRHLEFVK